MLEEQKRLAEAVIFPGGGAHLEGGRFAYFLVNRDNRQLSGLYHLTSFSEAPERVNAVPPADFASDLRVVWLPDGSAALIGDLDGRTYYSPADGDFLYDLTRAVGIWGHSFTWLPPVGEQ